MVKTILGEKKRGVPILSHFSAIFGFRKFIQVFDISRGKKHGSFIMVGGEVFF